MKNGIISIDFKIYTRIYTMDEFIKELDVNLDYLNHEITENEVIIYVASKCKLCKCPYCEGKLLRLELKRKIN